MFGKLVGRAAQVVPTNTDDAKDLAEKAASMAVDVAGDVANKGMNLAKDAAMEGRERAEKMLQQMKETIEIWIKRKLQLHIGRVVDRIPPIVKDALEDEDMPRWVSRGKDHMVETAWPDVRSEIMWEVAVFLDKAEQQPEDDAKGACCCCAFFRYHMFPYDKSIWRKLRDPWFILFQIIPMVPLYGIHPIWFTFIFLVIDRGDEFQLVSFILSFKGLAFISQGLVRAIIGFTQFLGCVTAGADHEEHSCEKRGPGTTGNIWALSIGLFLQIVVVWIAFCYLRCSTRKGQSLLNGDLEEVKQEGSRGSKGGYLLYFLWYDLACFVICAVIIGYTVQTRPKLTLDDWPLQHVLFSVQVFYGLLSAPFFIFTLPVLQRLLTHILPTAYDRKGVCRQPIKPEKKKNDDKPQEELVTEEEVQDLYTKLKSIIPTVPMVFTEGR